MKKYQVLKRRYRGTDVSLLIYRVPTTLQSFEISSYLSFICLQPDRWKEYVASKKKDGNSSDDEEGQDDDNDDEDIPLSRHKIPTKRYKVLLWSPVEVMLH